MLYVVNKYRNLTQDVASALQVMREIEVKSKLKVTGIVNNSHLREYTDEKTILDALDFGIECAENVSVPYVCTTAPEMLLRQKNAALLPAWDRAMFYPVQMLVTTPWE